MSYTMVLRRGAAAIAALSVSLVAWDANAACGSGLACELCDVSGYTPTTQSAPAAPSNACSSTDIQGFTTACFGTGATQQTCSAWQSSAPSGCVSCLLTQQTASTWGALVCTTQSCSVNTPGCVDLALGQVSKEKSQGGSGSCGDLINASYGCQDYACGTCSTTDGPPTSFSQCTQSAIANECATYASAVNSTTGACASIAGDAGAGPAALCFPASDTDIPAFLSYFCAATTTPPSDGGTGTDGGGVKSDAGPSDAGKGDGGSFGGSKGGCHCDVASPESTPKAGALLAALGLAAFAARRRRARSW